MREPLVSILIPVYRRFDLACDTVECAINQTYKNIEIIIVDNFSEDETYEKLVTKFGSEEKVSIFQNEANLGAVGNWESCLSKANGAYVIFLWSDDLISADFIQKSMNMLMAHPSASFVFSSVYMFDKTDKVENLMKAGSSKRDVTDIRYRFGHDGEHSGYEFIKDQFIYHREKVPVSPACAVFKKEKVRIEKDIPNKMGYRHRNNGAGIDLLIFLNAIEAKDSVCFINETLSFFRGHPGSISTFDKTIELGYRTAEEYYISRRDDDKLTKWFLADICIGKMRVKTNRIEQDSELAKYYMGYNLCTSTIPLIPFVLYKRLRTLKESLKYRFIVKSSL